MIINKSTDFHTHKEFTLMDTTISVFNRKLYLQPLSWLQIKGGDILGSDEIDIMVSKLKLIEINYD